MTWLLLIYTVPSAPSRLRAAIWRAIKQAGALYLRAGVCVLPERAETTAAFQQIAAQVRAFAGEATVVTGAHLAAERATALVDAMHAARAAEYAELASEAGGFLAHIRRETRHRAFTFAEWAELAGDVAKIKRWMEQVRARDYFASTAAERVATLLARCDEALATFMEATAREDESSR